MPTEYYPFKVALSDGQRRDFVKAVETKLPLTLRIKKDQLNKGDTLHLTKRQIAHLKKKASSGEGAEIRFTKTQLMRTKIVTGGNLFSAAFNLARAAAPAVGKAVGMAGLSFGAEKLLKKIFGGNIGPKHVELYNLVQMLTPAQKQQIQNYLVGQGLVRGGGLNKTIWGTFLGMLASIGIPLAIDLVKNVFGGGMQIKPRGRRSVPRLPPQPSYSGGAMQMRPPPVYGRWEDWEYPMMMGRGKKK